MHQYPTFDSDIGHIPVLLEPMLHVLKPKAGGIYLDATFGGGGYTRKILQEADCIVHALDQDPEAYERSLSFKSQFPDRFIFHQGSFSQLLTLFNADFFDGIVFDFGVSSFQFDTAHRGFSFRFDGPLDMRMNPNGGTDAATVVNTFSQEDLTKIIHVYGEEPKARHVAKAIVEQRKQAPFETTTQLAQCVRKHALRKKDIDNATLTFQGLRIFVNNELIEIVEALKACITLLKNQGTLVTVTFHSLEDRLCKQFFKKQLPQIDYGTVDFAMFTSKPIMPSLQEISQNPRSRSSKLRAAQLIRKDGF